MAPLPTTAKALGQAGSTIVDYFSSDNADDEWEIESKPDDEWEIQGVSTEDDEWEIEQLPATTLNQQSLPEITGLSGDATQEGRPIMQNADGSFSTERTITITDDRINEGRPTNIPTLFGGTEYDQWDAIEIIAKNKGVDPDTGKPVASFNSEKEALDAARARSAQISKAMDIKPVEMDSFFGNVGELAIESVKQTKANMAAVLATGQWENISDESKNEVAKILADAAKAHDIPKELEERYKKVGEEATDVADEWKKGNYGKVALESADFLGEVIYESITNPKGTVYAAAEQAANLGATWVPGIALGKAGAVIGGAVGGAVGGPGGAVVGATVGGTGGFMSGAALGSYLVETGGQIREFIQKSGGDPTDPGQVLAALSNPEVRKDMLDRASAKGLSIAAWDAAANLLGIKLLKGAEGPVSAVKRAVGAEAAQVGSAAAGEIQGQYLATGTVNPAEVGQEVALELGPGGIADIALAHHAARKRAVAGKIDDIPEWRDKTNTERELGAALQEGVDQTDLGDAAEEALRTMAPRNFKEPKKTPVDTSTPVEQDIPEGFEVETLGARPVFDDIKQQLKSAGKSEEEATVNAEQMDNFYQRLSANTDTPVEQLYERYGLNVMKPGDAASKKSTTYDQFAGPKAKTADLDALAAAEARTAGGEDIESVRKETGWKKGPDNKWRFEISDDEAIIKPGADKEGTGDLAIDKDNVYRLGEILDHKKLYEAYPELENYKVQIVGEKDKLKSPVNAGGFDTETNTIIMQAMPGAHVENKEKFLSTLLHEVQHVIQTEERFSSGGNKLIARNAAGKKAVEKFNEIDNKYKEAGKVVPEVMQELQALEKLDSELKAAYGVKEFDENNNYNVRSNKEMASRISEGDKALRKQAADKYYAAIEKAGGWDSAEVSKLIQLAAERYRARPTAMTDSESFQAYLSLYGEVEARNTEARMNLTDEARKQISPETTAPIKEKDTLVAKPIKTGVIEQSVYHGSPHEFLKFQTDKIGTGEGAQAYGHGLYFAENPDIAGEYQANTVNMDEIRKLNDKMSVIAKQLDKLETGAGYRQYTDQAKGDKLVAEYDRLMGEREKTRTKPGLMYEVDIDDKHVENMLDWDAPLSDQTDSVKKAIAKLPEIAADPELTRFLLNENKTVGGALVKGLAEQYTEENGKKKASELLASVGIPGIKYYDATSRNVKVTFQVSGGERPQAFNEKQAALDHISKYGGELGETGRTRNFVVFDESIIEMKSIDGKPVAETAKEADGKKSITDTPEFKKWFGDSKVVDENGEPLVVYHGTGSIEGVEEFKPHLTGKGNDQYGSGFYFTSNAATASGYATDRRFSDQEKLGGEDSPGVLPVYLSIKNPIKVTGETSNLRDVGLDLSASQVRQMLNYSEAVKRDINDERMNPLGDHFEAFWEEGPQDWMLNDIAETYKGDDVESIEVELFDNDSGAFRKALSEVTGYDGVEVTFTETGEKHVIAWFPEQIKSTFNRGTFDPKDPRILYQDEKLEGEDLLESKLNKNLLVQHNLSLENLIHANELGGLASPSIAVTRKGSPMSSFGEIVLIGGPSMVDPKSPGSAYLYDADAYSPRYPTTRLKIKESNVIKLWEDFKVAAEIMGPNYLSEDLDKDTLSKNGASALINSPIPVYAYLMETGKKLPRVVKTKRKKVDKQLSAYFHSGPSKAKYDVKEYKHHMGSYWYIVSGNDEIGQYGSEKEAWDNVKKLKKIKKLDYRSVDPQRLAQDPEFQDLVIQIRLKEYQRIEDKDVRELMLEEYSNISGIERRNIAYSEAQALRASMKPVVTDYYKMRDKLRNIVKNDPEFKKWARDKINKISDGEQMAVVGKSGGTTWIPHILENVVADINRRKKKGEGFNYGVGNVRSAVARNFKSIDQIKRNADRLVTEEDMKPIKEEMRNEFVGLAEKLGRYYKYDSERFGYLDEFSKNIHDFIKGGRLPDYKNVPSYLVDEVREFLTKLKNADTEYFEGKFYRAVNIGEFSAAVVPQGARYDEAVQILNDNGITKIKRYNNQKRGDAALKKAIESLGSKVYFQDKVDQPFYSAALKATQDLKQESGTPEQMLAMIKKTPGVKQEELDWIGLEEWLGEQTGKITKREIVDFIQANEVRIEEVTKSTGKAEIIEEDNGYSIYEDNKFIEWYETRNEADNNLSTLGLVGGTPTIKFAEHQTPGGKNYRELLLTLPDKPLNVPGLGREAFDELGRLNKELRDNHNLPPEKMARFTELTAKKRKFDEAIESRSVSYTGGHFDEPNILAHIRFNERTDADGKKVLFIEEVQSDWHQNGRKMGYKPKSRPIQDRIARDYPRVPTGRSDWSLSILEKAGVPAKEIEEWGVEMRQNIHGVPDAPFKTTWPLLAMKRMIRYAAENGFDSVAWTTGEQQAERYDLSKQIKSIDYNINNDDTYTLFVTGLNGENLSNVIGAETKNITIDRVEALVGKDVANKIKNKEGGFVGESAGRNAYSLKGVDLKVGGEGMKAFYDKMLPSMLNKYVKKWGGKVGETKLPNARMAKQAVVMHDLQADVWVVEDIDGNVIETFNTEYRAMQFADSIDGQLEPLSTHSLNITPAMREAVMKGQPLFQSDKMSQDRARGRIEIYENREQFNITLFEKADKSTFLHETGHYYLEVLTDVVESGKASKQLESDYNIILDHIGAVKGKPITKTQHEKFARSYEAYVMTGKAPSLKLRAAFERLSAWLKKVYASLKDLNVELSDDVQAVFDRMFASDVEIAEMEGVRAEEAKEVDKAYAARLKKQRDVYAEQSKINPAVDDILAAIAKAGGLNREEAIAQGIDPADMNHRGWRIKPVFTKDGVSFDAMAEKLSQHQYPVTNTEGNYDVNTLLDSLYSALAGESKMSLFADPADTEEGRYGPDYSDYADDAESIIDDFDPSPIDEHDFYDMADLEFQAGTEISMDRVKEIREDVLSMDAALTDAEINRIYIHRLQEALDEARANKSDANVTAVYQQGKFKAPEKTGRKQPGGRTEGSAVSEAKEGLIYERDTSDIQGGQRGEGVSSPGATAGQEQLALFDKEGLPKEKKAAHAQVVDTFHTRYKHVEVGTIRLGLDKIETKEDAAHALAPIRKGGQEVFFVMVVDKDGKPVHIYRHTLGVKDGSTVDPLTVVGSIASIKDAHGVWFAHNHPSGDPLDSNADVSITRKLAKSLDGTGVKIHGHVIFGRGQKANVLDENGERSFIKIRPMPRSKTLPVTERVIRKQPPADLVPLASPGHTRDYVKGLESKNGLLLMNNRHAVVGVISLSKSEMLSLRKGGMVNRILAGFDATNAIASIIFAEDKEAVHNVGKLLNNTGVRVLDGIHKAADGKYTSMAETGESVGESPGVFYQDEGPDTSKILPGDILPDSFSIDYGEMDAEGRVSRKVAGTNLQPFLDRLESSDDAKELFTRVVHKFEGDIKSARRGKITWKETERMASLLGWSPEELMRRREGQAFNAEEFEASRAIIDQAMSEIMNAAEEAVGGSDEEILLFQQRLGKFVPLAEQVLGARAEWGRMGSIMRKQAMQAKQLGSILDSLGGRKSIETKAIALLDLQEKGLPVDNIQKAMVELSEPRLIDKIIEVWINFLLSGPQTHAVNIVSNQMISILSVPEHLLAAGVGKLHGGEKVYFREVLPRAYGLLSGAKEGAMLAAQVFSRRVKLRVLAQHQAMSEGLTGKEINVRAGELIKAIKNLEGDRPTKLSDEEAVLWKLKERSAETEEATDLFTKIEAAYPKAISGTKGKIIRIPGTALTAMDEFYKAIGFRQELNSMAMRQAIKEKLKGAALVNRVADITNKVSETRLQTRPKETTGEEKLLWDIHDKAVQIARHQTFTEPLGPIGNWFSEATRRWPFPFKIVMPFVRTPVNIVKYAGRRSPFAVAMPSFQADIKEGGAVRDVAIGRVIFGTGIGLTVMMMAMQGAVTGGGPGDPNERRVWLQKFKPYSVKIGDKWYSYGRLEPLGMIMGVSADLASVIEVMPEKDVAEVVSLIHASIVKNLASKTFLRGITDAIAAYYDPERYGKRWIMQFGGTAIPTGIAQMARLEDPTLRRAETMIEKWKSRIPYLSKDLLPRLDIFGEPIVLNGGLGPDIVSPVYIGLDPHDPVVDEMLRLGIYPSSLPKNIGGIELTPQQYNEYAEMAGKETKAFLDRLVKLPSYKGMADIFKQDMISKIFTDIRKEARTKLIMKYPEIERERIEKEIKKYKAPPKAAP